MNRLFTTLTLALGLVSFTAGDALERFAIIAGSNDGGPGREVLRYAASDAKQFSDVLTTMGGLKEVNSMVMLNPDRDDILQGFGFLKSKIKKATTAGRQVQFVFYYSGHSDDQGLLLREQRLTYEDLKAGLNDLGADVRIVVLDSCSSGAFTRTKGGQIGTPFLMDLSTQVEGHAFLTSSTAEELSQESDRIESSFFTHALVEAMRGAGDSNADGAITLNEAYEYAYGQTMADTQATKTGTQHPAFDIQLNGKGNLILTDLRTRGAKLVFPKDVRGKITVRDVANHLVAEVQKPGNQELVLGVDKGYYRVGIENNGTLLETNVIVESIRDYPIRPSVFVTVEKTSNATRGVAHEEPVSDLLHLDQSFVLRHASWKDVGNDVTARTTFRLTGAAFYLFLAVQGSFNGATSLDQPSFGIGPGLGLRFPTLINGLDLHLDGSTSFMAADSKLDVSSKASFAELWAPDFRTFATLRVWRNFGIQAGWDHPVFTENFHRGFDPEGKAEITTPWGRLFVGSRFFVGVQL